MKFLLCLVLVGVAVAAVEANESVGCQTLCPLSYAPICATDDSGNTQTFPNECALQTENCLKKSTFQKTTDGPCP
ncbi:vasotab-TY2 [Lutzomyia longipalpis]|uniref:vasotab-TY2 n=1 Tax=Lutzomyia longipalpis TaxID=7200 RepID=UPI002483A15C|nr:vasotab-TY2 [Lutzomyia longipalpis]